MKRKEESKGIASLIGASFVYSFFGILTRTIGFAIPVFYGSFIRQLVSLAILAIPLFGKRLWMPINQWKRTPA